MTAIPELMDYFLDFSIVVTGFSRFHLQGTGQADLYFKCVCDIVGETLVTELLKMFHELDTKADVSGDESILTKGLRSDIFGSEKLGPIARNIVKLWYVATWYQLPKAWRDAYGASDKDRDFVVSPQAYPEGLLWPSIGVTPPGAKAPGYGTWTEPPVVGLPKSKEKSKK